MIAGGWGSLFVSPRLKGLLTFPDGSRLCSDLAVSIVLLPQQLAMWTLPKSGGYEYLIHSFISVEMVHLKGCLLSMAEWNLFKFVVQKMEMSITWSVGWWSWLKRKYIWKESIHFKILLEFGWGGNPSMHGSHHCTRISTWFYTSCTNTVYRF